MHDRMYSSACDDWTLETAPFTIDYQPFEQISTLKMLTDTDNLVFEKVMKVFVDLVFEVDDLERIAKRKVYPTLMTYGHQHPKDEVQGSSLTRQLANEAEVAIHFSKFLPSLQEIYFFTRRMNNVGCNLVRQLACVFNDKSKLYTGSFKNVRMATAWDALKKLLVIMITMDAIIENNRPLNEALQIFKKVLKSVSMTPVRFSFTEDEIKPFGMMMQLMEGAVLEGNIYQGFISQAFHIQGKAPVILNNAFLNAFLSMVRESVEGILSALAAADKKDWYSTLFCNSCYLTDLEQMIVGGIGLFVMFPQIFQQPFPDKSCFRDLWDITKRVPVVLLSSCSGAIPFYPALFIVSKYPKVVVTFLAGDKVRASDVETDSTTMLREMDATLSNRVLVAALKANVWAIGMESSLADAARAASQILKETAKKVSTEKVGLSGGGDDEDDEFFEARDEEIAKRTGGSSSWSGSAGSKEGSSGTQVVTVASEVINDRTLGFRSQLIQTGMRLASSLQHLIYTYVSLYVALGDVFPAGNLRIILFAVATLKKIAYVFYSRSVAVGSVATAMIEKVRMELIDRINLIAERSGLSLAAHLSPAQLDQLAAVKIFAKLLSGALTPQRIRAAEVVLDTLRQKNVMVVKELNYFQSVFSTLRVMVSLPKHLNAATDCSFLYWCKPIYPQFFEMYFTDAALSSTFSLFCVALHDPLRFVQTNEEVSKDFVEDVQKCMQDALIDPLGRAIETRLRLDVQQTMVIFLSESAKHHSSRSDSPSRSSAGSASSSAAASAAASAQAAASDHIYITLCSLPPVRLFGEQFSLKSRVELYLSTTFYNLTTIHLSDWRTYSEMTSLARQKYSLILDDPHLPTQTLEQGLDMLEVARNLHVFVSRYTYSMNSQLFVEIPGDNKTINSMSVRHFANSIRTHGTGIMNTTVNLAYHLLTKNIMLFCQFLQDEHIKSFLAKDFRFWKKNKEQLNGQYPWDMAQRLIMDVRRLGTSDDGVSFMDKFRRLITELGNILGFVRMIRSGSQRYCSEAIKFVPDLGEIISFKETVEQDKLSPATAGCAESFDNTLDNLLHNFAEGTDFFQLLLSAFRDKLKDDGVNTMYLRGFPFIIPALTVTFIDAMISQKDSLAKKRRGGAFNDDGFAMGITFLLSLLNQHNAFGSLHWFNSVFAHIAAQRKDTEEKMARMNRRGASEDAQTLQITLKKWETYQLEFELLSFTFAGARVLFKE